MKNLRVTATDNSSLESKMRIGQLPRNYNVLESPLNVDITNN